MNARGDVARSGLEPDATIDRLAGAASAQQVAELLEIFRQNAPKDDVCKSMFVGPSTTTIRALMEGHVREIHYVGGLCPVVLPAWLPEFEERLERVAGGR